jgi:hypothetical protein
LVSGVDELIAFLTACLDEDERVALEATAAGASGGAEHWRTERVEYRHADTGVHDTWVIRGERVKTPTLAMCPIDITPRITNHIARWDPARVLAEVEAKRRVLDEHPPDGDGFCGDGIGLVGCKWSYPCPTVRLLAQPYAGRPGWRAEWQARWPA